VSTASLTYAAVTPVRDDAENLRRLAATLAAQTLTPNPWVIVENGSTDDTPVVARELAERHPWIRLRSIEGSPTPVPGAPIVRAFHAGLEMLAGLPPTDVIVKLDADVSMDPDHFERLLAAFAADERLGIAGGSCYEETGEEWRVTHVTGDHVRGAVRAYRSVCLAAVSPLEERMGWDTIDELKAAVLGWNTRLLLDLPFYHHRPVGARDGVSGERWAALGASAYYMGYRPWYIAVRTLFRARRDPKALRMLASYAAAAITRKPRHADAAVVARLREQQRLASLPHRVREALGRRVPNAH
jgi:biofilm PGA synthesis N-glycosyltransferase PgaC